MGEVNLVVCSPEVGAYVPYCMTYFRRLYVTIASRVV